MSARVVHVLGNARLEATGIARIVASLHRHMEADKYRHQVCIVGSSGPLVETLRETGIEVHVVPWRQSSRDAIGLLRLLRHVRDIRPNILHFHWGGGHTRRFIARFSNARIVQHLHSPIDESDANVRTVSTDGSVAVIAVSKSVAALSAHPCTRVIYSGVELPPQSGQISTNTIGFAGRLSPVKGAAHLLHAMALLSTDLPALRLEIAGDGPLREELEALAHSLEIQERISFLGWVEDLDIQSRGWLALIQPSLDEGVPLSVLEAMAAGCPVIASRVGGLPEVVYDGTTGLLVPPADAQTLAHTIRRLFADPDMAARIGQAARASVEQRFQTKRMALAVEALYDELLAK